MRFKNITPAEIEELNPRAYPGFPEYTLIDLKNGSPLQYYRGASHEHLNIPEARVWNHFIANHFQPDKEKKVLLLHQCSWAKPYDMSATLEPIVNICNKYPFIHRVIVSNIGLIPAELQMNPIFCSYDWVPLMGDEPEDVTQAFFNSFKEHFENYMKSNKDQYWGVLALASRSKGSKAHIIAEVLSKYNLPLFLIPDEAGWEVVKTMKVRDQGDKVRSKVVLKQLDEKLKSMQKILKDQGLL